ncbi:MAG: patatin family protein [Bacteroidaceae bacterium]|nr:patatin family protein [Bacteroidaceae bacterium]
MSESNKIKIKSGLVLEGGAMRGLFSAGAMDVLMEAGIEFDGIIGVSAGAAFGCNYKSRQVGRALRYNQQFAHDRRYCSLWSLFKTGDLFNAEFAYHIVPTTYDLFDNEAFESNPASFFVVCTDLKSGKAVYKELSRGGDDTYEWIRASASMPLCSRPVELEGHLLLDGGVTDSIPLQYFQDVGFSRNIVVLTQPDGYVKHRNKFVTAMRLSGLRKYPQFIEAVSQRHEMYNAQTQYVREAEKRGEAIVIRPDTPLPIGHVSHDPAEMQRVYDIGRAVAQRRINEILDFLK